MFTSFFFSHKLEIAVAQNELTHTSGVRTLDIYVVNLEQKPHFINLPATITLPEDDTSTRRIFQVSLREKQQVPRDCDML